MSTPGAGTVVGRGIILVTPQLVGNIGNDLNRQLQGPLRNAQGQFQRQGRGLGGALGGGIMAGLGLPISGVQGAVLGLVGALGLSVSKAASFEKQLSAIKAVSGATAGEMDQMRSKALQLGADTKYSASEAALAMEELVKAGVSVPDVLNGAADATVSLAAAGEVELPRAAEIAANAMNSFGLSAAQMPHVADQIAGAANASAISVDEYAMSMSAASSVAKLAGVSFEDTTTAIALMGNAGIKGSDAGTSLKTMFMRLTPQTKQQADEMKRLGIITADGKNQFYDAAGNAKSLSEISGILHDRLGNLTAEQKQQALATLFGSDAIRGAAILTEQGAAGFDKMAASIGKVKAADVAKERMNNLSGAVEQLKGTVETLAIQAGSFLLPVLTDLAQGANWALGEIPRLAAGLADLGGAVVAGFQNPTASIASSVGTVEGLALRLGAVLARAWSAVLPGLRELGRFITADVVPTFRNLVELGAELVRGFAPVAAVVGGVILVAFRGLTWLIANVLGPAIAGLTGFLADHKVIVTTVAVAVGTFALAYWALTAAQAAVFAAQTAYAVVIRTLPVILRTARAAVLAFNAALWANPVGAVVIALAALGAALYYAYTRSETFRNFVDAAWRGVVAVVMWAWNSYLKPIFMLWVWWYKSLGSIAIWLWSNVISPYIGFVVAMFRLLGTVAGWVFGALIMPALRLFGAVVGFVWGLVGPIFGLIGGAFRLLGTIFGFVWGSVLRPLFSAFMAVAKFLATILIVVVFGPIVLAWQALAAVFGFVWNTILQPIFRAVGAVAGWLWTNVLSPVFGWIADRWRMMVFGIQLAWNSVLKPVWNAVQSAAGWLWNNVLSPIFGLIARGWDLLATGFRIVNDNVIQPVFRGVRTGVEALQGVFRSVVDTIGRVWDTLTEKLKAPIRSAFAWINRNILEKLEAVTSKFGLNMPRLPEAFAQGGMAPGGRPILVGEEGPELVTLPGKRWVHTADETQKMLGGGISYGGGSLGRGYSPRDHTGGFSFNPLKAIGAGAKWAGSAVDKAWDGVVRIGGEVVEFGRGIAASGLDKILGALVGPLNGLTGPMPEFPQKYLRQAYADLRKAAVEWVRGKDDESLLSDYTGTLGGAIGAIIDYAKLSGIPFAVTSTLRPGDDGFHGTGNAVDFDPGDARLFDLASHFLKIKGNLLELILGNGWGNNVYRGRDVGRYGVYGQDTVDRVHGGANSHLHIAATLSGINRALGRGASPAAMGGTPQNIAKGLLGARGWASQWPQLDALIRRESGWNVTARNPSSGAYGLPQSLPGNKMAAFGADWQTNPRTQLLWMMDYIGGRYGSPAAAWAHSQRFGWYDQGGMFPDDSIGFNTSGSAERVLTSRQNDAFERMVAVAEAGGTGPLFGDVYLQDRADLDLLVAKAKNELTPTSFAGV